MRAGEHHEAVTRRSPDVIPPDRSFGLVLAAFLVLVAVLPLRHGGHLRIWALITAAAVLLIALVSAQLLHPVTVAAMKFSYQAARVSNPIMLAILYTAVFVPAGVYLRIAGKDPLRLKLDAAGASYWNTPERVPLNMEHQF